jgi:hypothetical protein
MMLIKVYVENENALKKQIFVLCCLLGKSQSKTFYWYLFVISRDSPAVNEGGTEDIGGVNGKSWEAPWSGELRSPTNLFRIKASGTDYCPSVLSENPSWSYFLLFD